MGSNVEFDYKRMTQFRIANPDQVRSALEEVLLCTSDGKPSGAGAYFVFPSKPKHAAAGGGGGGSSSKSTPKGGIILSEMPFYITAADGSITSSGLVLMFSEKVVLIRHCTNAFNPAEVVVTATPVFMLVVSTGWHTADGNLNVPGVLGPCSDTEKHWFSARDALQDMHALKAFHSSGRAWRCEFAMAPPRWLATWGPRGLGAAAVTGWTQTPSTFRGKAEEPGLELDLGRYIPWTAPGPRFAGVKGGKLAVPPAGTHVVLRGCLTSNVQTATGLQALVLHVPCNPALPTSKSMDRHRLLRATRTRIVDMAVCTGAGVLCYPATTDPHCGPAPPPTGLVESCVISAETAGYDPEDVVAMLQDLGLHNPMAPWMHGIKLPITVAHPALHPAKVMS